MVLVPPAAGPPFYASAESQTLTFLKGDVGVWGFFFSVAE